MKKTILMLFIAVILFAQHNWIRTCGGAGNDNGFSVIQTADGSYVIAGRTYSFGAGAADVYLIKIDSLGDTLWTKTYGGMNEDEGNSVQQTTDGGYIIAGTTTSYGAGSGDVYLIKTDTAGTIIWTKTYGGVNGDAGYSVQQTSDGGYIIAASTSSPTRGFLIKTNDAGDTLWTRYYGGMYNYGCFSVRQTMDGGYILAGLVYYPAQGNDDLYLIRTNAGGDTLWTKTYGGPVNDRGASVQLTRDAGYIIAGFTNSYGAGGGDFYLVKTDSMGDTLWARTYGGEYEDGAFSVQQTTDGGFIVVGYAGTSSIDAYLVKTDSTGDTLWTKTYGRMNTDAGYSVQQTLDGGYIIAGNTQTIGPGDMDVYIIKTDTSGYAAVEERKTNMQNPGIMLQSHPNPFVSYARIPGHEKEDFTLSDVTGRCVGIYKGVRIGENLPAGVYFVIPQNKNLKPLRIVKVR